MGEITIGLVVLQTAEDATVESTVQLVVGDKKDFFAIWNDGDTSVKAFQEIDVSERFNMLLEAIGAFEENDETIGTSLQLLLEATFRLGQKNHNTVLTSVIAPIH